MSIEMLNGLYDHHHPDHLRMAAHFIGYRSRQNLSIPFAQADRVRHTRHTPRNLLKSLVGVPGYVSNSVARA
jgi:hypothetical protein